MLKFSLQAALLLVLVGAGSMPAALAAQQEATLFGHVRNAATGAPVEGASVTVEGTERGAVTDSTGRYSIARVPAGPQVLVVERIGFARVRLSINIPPDGTFNRDVTLAERALRLPSLTVTSEPGGRARGEAGTASVINREAIEVQTATSLAGVLELVPGVELEPPGLGGTQQFALRSVPTSSVASLQIGGPSAADLASFGTLIILDGVPLSNNANLQTTGPRGEFSIPSSARGGIDLRRIPASTLERVEVIRGVPSARYGDLTQGVIVVETRAGAFDSRSRALFDPFSAGGTFSGGWGLGDMGSALTSSFDLTRTRVAPGWRDDLAYRFAGQLAHSIGFGEAPRPPDAGTAPARPKLTLDSRLDLYRVFEESPENPEVFPGRASWNRDGGVRASERARLALGGGGRLELTSSLEYQRQRSMAQQMLSRRAMPFTDRLEEGRQEGHYIGGPYLSRVNLEGDVFNFFNRLEADRPFLWLGAQHRLRGGLELRREWNSGDGYRFPIEFPPQVSFTGVQGFDRPRSFDRIPPLATSALYLDDRFYRTLAGNMALDLQAGLRLGVLHRGGLWGPDVRDVAFQPRLNAQFAPWAWLRLRAGIGRMAKAPTLGQLHPAPQYFDVVNVNWFADDPIERLAVLTTFLRDPTNHDLGFSRTWKREAGIELSAFGGDGWLSVVGFNDRTEGGVGFRPAPDFVLRHRYALSDSTLGNGVPTEILEPPIGADTMPILLDVPSNNLTLESSGVELTARLPEIRPIRVRLEIQGAWVSTELLQDGLDFGRTFRDFQVDPTDPRAPFWESITQTGTRGLMTYRMIHHRPSLGLVVTTSVQHIFREETQNVGATDSLAFSGYVTRSGQLVRVPRDARGQPEFADLREPRAGTFINRSLVAPDWLMSVQVAFDLPLDGRLSFYAFNALDRKGSPATGEEQARRFPALRFGVEGSMPLGGVARGISSLVGGGS